MTNKTEQQLEQIRADLKIEQFTGEGETAPVIHWRKWRDLLGSLVCSKYERVFPIIDEARGCLDMLNAENLAKINPLLDIAEKETKEEQKRETKQIAKTFAFVNTKAEEVPQGIKRALLNKKALFVSCGFLADKKIIIEGLDSNKPLYLAKFDSDLRNSLKCARWFYIIALDGEQAQKRRLWGMNKNILCKITLGEAQGLQAERWAGSDCYERQADIYGLETYWRKSDYETARKCAKKIFCVYQEGREIDNIKEKQKVRKEERSFLNSIDYYRHDTSKASFDQDKRLYREDKRGFYYYSCDRFDFFDVCGWNVSNKQHELKEKARQLKEARAKVRLIETGCAKELQTTQNLICELVASLDQLTAMLKNYLLNNKKIRLFWLQSRIERTTNQIATLCDLKGQLETKNDTFRDVAQMLERYEGRTNEARHTIQLNAIYLAMTEQEHAETDSAKNNAIYYGYYNEFNGTLILDIAKAQEKLDKRGY